MIRLKYKYAAVLAALILVSACSTTKNLPEGEKLYVGIDNVEYSGTPRKYSAKHYETDSTGVITAIGNAVSSVGDFISGAGNVQNPDSLSSDDVRENLNYLRGKKNLSREEKKKLREREKADIEAFSTAQEEVDAVLAYPPNNAIFGSSSLRSPFPVGLWIYNDFVNKKGALGRWMFKTFAATPVLLSTVNPDMRARVATNTLHNYGYFSGKVTSQVLPQRNQRKAKVAYRVYVGPVHRYDSIAYLGFPARADSLLKATEGSRLLRKGDAFSVVNLSAEQSRIEKLFRENGYYFYTAAYTTYRADTLLRPGLVQLRVSPAADRSERARRQWYIGNTFINVWKNDTLPLTSSLERRDMTFRFSGDKLPLRPGMWRRSIFHRKGDLFRLSLSDLTLEKLNSIGVFSRLDLNYVPRDTSASCDTLDIAISAVMDKMYDSSFEMNATMKSNQQAGPGVSFGIAKRNAFGGGEKVSFKIFGSYEWQTGAGKGERNSLLNSYELGTELSFEFPRFVLPGLSRRHARFPATTTYSLSSDWRNRSSFFQMVNFGLEVNYDWFKKRSSRHNLSLGLDFDKLLSKTATFDSIMNANPALYVSMRDQFVPSISYTFTYTSDSKHRNPVWVQLSAKEAGNLVSGIYAATGRSFNKTNKQLFGSPFAQFVKLTAEAHHKIKFNPRFFLATRLFAGAIWSYGNSTRAPYADQFYVGGANSVRAFTVRSIGPGSYRTAQTRYSYMDQTGDVKLEANAELRARLFGSLHGAAFLDAGNVWLMRDDPLRPGGKFSAKALKDIAVGTGVGLRYDLEFLVLRLDMGIALHAPYETSRSGFYNIEKFKDGLAFHFAIGYPF